MNTCLSYVHTAMSLFSLPLPRAVVPCAVVPPSSAYPTLLGTVSLGCATSTTYSRARASAASCTRHRALSCVHVAQVGIPKQGAPRAIRQHPRSISVCQAVLYGLWITCMRVCQPVPQDVRQCRVRVAQDWPYAWHCLVQYLAMLSNVMMCRRVSSRHVLPQRLWTMRGLALSRQKRPSSFDWRGVLPSHSHTVVEWMSLFREGGGQG